MPLMGCHSEHTRLIMLLFHHNSAVQRVHWLWCKELLCLARCNLQFRIPQKLHLYLLVNCALDFWPRVILPFFRQSLTFYFAKKIKFTSKQNWSNTTQLFYFKILIFVFDTVKVSFSFLRLPRAQHCLIENCLHYLKMR